MCQKHAFALDCDALCCAVHLNAGLLFKPTECPDIVIADIEMHIYAFVSQYLERAEDGTVLLFALIVPEVLAPVIEDVSQEVYSCGILCHMLEHMDDGLLMGLRILNSP